MSTSVSSVMSPATERTSPPLARRSLVVAQLFTGLLMVVAGIWLIVLFQQGFNGGGSLVGIGAVEIVLGILSLGALPGLQSGRSPGWTRPLSIAGAVFNAAVIVFAAAATLLVTYPGGAVVLLILVNDVIIGELVVMYFCRGPQPDRE